MREDTRGLVDIVPLGLGAFLRTQNQGSRGERGFTLIELLVVISIIVVLLSVLVPALSRGRAMGKSVRCLANMRACAQAVVVFAGNHNGRMQIATDEIGLAAVDRKRQKFAYDRTPEYKGELLGWPVALGQATGIEYKSNMDWGVRASSFADALKLRKEIELKEGFDSVVCPADYVQISTPFYPRNKSGGNDGLRGGESEDKMTYWGMLSYGLNEDIAGVEVEESGGNAACWRAAETQGGWISCRGEVGYPPASPCSGGTGSGRRLRGQLEKAFDPATVGLIFEAGADTDTVREDEEPEYANLITSTGADGPYLGDFQQRFGKRMPTKRHPDGRLNVLFADTHGETVKPVEFSEDNVFGKRLPSKYSPNARVSPYPPRDTKRR